jgi:hypothetical protein
MGLTTVLNKLDKRFAWSFLGFVLAIFFGGVSLYTEFFKNNSPLVEFELLSSTPVLDVRENLPDLEVLYQGQDISKHDRALSVVLVRIVNRGTADLLNSHYDNKAPLGFTIENANLIRAEVVGSSNDYLGKASGVHTEAPPLITLEPVILEPNEWYLVKVLLLHSTSSKPVIVPRGKVAGMRGTPTLTTVAPTESKGFWSRTYTGNIWIQLVRLVSYFFAAILIAIGVGVPIALTSDAFQKRRRRKLIERFKKGTKLHLDSGDEFIFSGYEEAGATYLQRLLRTVTDTDRLQKLVKSAADKSDSSGDDLLVEYRALAGSDAQLQARSTFIVEERYHSISEMIRQEFIREIDGQWVAVPERLRTLTSFIEFLELIGASRSD